MKITLYRHVYNAYHKIETILKHPILTNNDIFNLETNSSYYFPHNDNNKPIKYSYYKISYTLFNIGIGLDAGKDVYGRSGNFVFSNFIITIDDFDKLLYNPLPIIESLQNFIFSESDNEITIDVNEHINSFADTNTIFSAEILNIFINYIVYKNQLVLLKGDTQKFLSFLKIVYSLLPFNFSQNIYFTSYFYNLSDINNFKILGMPNKNINVDYSLFPLIIDLNQSVIIKNDSEIKNFIFLDKSNNCFFNEISIYNRIEYDLYRNDFSSLNNVFRLNSNLVDRFILLNKEKLLPLSNIPEYYYLFSYIYKYLSKNQIISLFDNYCFLSYLIVNSLFQKNDTLFGYFLDFIGSKFEDKKIFDIIVSNKSLFFKYFDYLLKNNLTDLISGIFNNLIRFYKSNVYDYLSNIIIDSVMQNLINIKSKTVFSYINRYLCNKQVKKQLYLIYKTFLQIYITKKKKYLYCFYYYNMNIIKKEYIYSILSYLFQFTYYNYSGFKRIYYLLKLRTNLNKTNRNSFLKILRDFRKKFRVNR